MKVLNKPSDTLVNEYVRKFRQNNWVYPSDKALGNLFSAFPKNQKIEDVLLKTQVLNAFYNTNIYDYRKMANHILGIGIDEFLQIGQSEAVDKIAEGHGVKRKKNEREIRFYSFATKYCSWHSPDEYPIYDRFVDKVLWQYQKEDKFSNFKREDLKHFDRFKSVIQDFRVFYRLERFKLKEIDNFLWIYGKENFTFSEKK